VPETRTSSLLIGSANRTHRHSTRGLAFPAAWRSILPALACPGSAAKSSS
jgi:hypothetical protein